MIAAKQTFIPSLKVAELVKSLRSVEKVSNDWTQFDLKKIFRLKT